MESWKLQLCVSFCVISMLRGCRCCYIMVKQLHNFAPTYIKLRIDPGKKRFIDPLQEGRRAHAGPLKTRLNKV